ncbi:hypothetical protein GGTG_10962 [Gaeumannomyces tritici R3-111a-1]|uniref:Uncharacterized protein n=1 Tax=Gaeumannomyces tritici (strain R3-111a-1) TaxID=644352 RepID=J3PBU1_GAET3|nr:hypothetical protein GGTG_10962 [Gaeumannomyces tritici R3-111a-1]EJT71708.1 hypothetical protein GGTG_10962 [Gaeumannomyces tritici R3-111a-1]
MNWRFGIAARADPCVHDHHLSLDEVMRNLDMEVDTAEEDVVFLTALDLFAGLMSQLPSGLFAVTSKNPLKRQKKSWERLRQIYDADNPEGVRAVIAIENGKKKLADESRKRRRVEDEDVKVRIATSGLEPGGVAGTKGDEKELAAPTRRTDWLAHLPRSMKQDLQST